MRTIKTGKEILLLLASLAIFAISFEVVLWVVERGRGFATPRIRRRGPGGLTGLIPGIFTVPSSGG